MNRLVFLLILLALLAWIVPVGSAAAAPASEIIYTVQPGDTLSQVAQRFNVTVAALISTNNLVDPDTIYVGQRLTIPAAGGWVDLQGSAKSAAGPVGAQRYLISQGDTLFYIAQRFGTTVAALKSLNELQADTIYAGQVLLIPNAATTVADGSAVYDRLWGPTAFVMRTQRVLDWLARNDAAAFDRVQRYVTTIGPSPTSSVAWSRLYGEACHVELPGGSIALSAAILYHEASHCQQWYLSGVTVSSSAAEAYAYGEQIDFMLRNNFDPRIVEFYAQLRSHYESKFTR